MLGLNTKEPIACYRCLEPVIGRGPAAKYCFDCVQPHNLERYRENQALRRQRLGCKIARGTEGLEARKRRNKRSNARTKKRLKKEKETIGTTLNIRKRMLVKRAKQRARRSGMEATITVADIIWPTHCPVLGVELNYGGDTVDKDKTRCASLDRWDNTRGYVPGNVYVLSFRANSLKSNATVEEMEKILHYMRHEVWYAT